MYWPSQGDILVITQDSKKQAVCTDWPSQGDILVITQDSKKQAVCKLCTDRHTGDYTRQ